jgi:flagellin-like protein
MMGQTADDGASNRAVSPVIGVILMVAITVILAAVIGAFVLEIGDQQETAPSTSFESDQSTDFYYRASWAQANLTTVEISHAGGNTIDITQANVKVEGNTSVWGSDAHDSWNGPGYGYPTPDIRETLGTNKKAEFSSGQTWRLHSYNGLADHNVKASDCYTLLPSTGGYAYLHANPCPDDIHKGPTPFDPLKQGHSVDVVWTASSGGKTQTLFKYTVQ